MTDHAAFLRAIVESPDDDLPRLVYADWLDEHGEGERAEFIRVQVELAGLESRRKDPRPLPGFGIPLHKKLDALRKRERELLEREGAEWCWDLLPVAANWYDASSGGIFTAAPPVEMQFVRGFVSQLILPWPDWQAHSAALLAACPIRRVNRAKACPNCRGVGTNDDIGYTCPVCRGTGKADDWRGDGSVRLTTWPDTMDLYRLSSKHGFGDSPGNRIERHLEIIAAEWPGVRFELPHRVTGSVSVIADVADLTHGMAR